MAKWAEPSNETINLITETLVGNGLDNFINTKVLVNNEQKKVVVIKKETPANKFAYGYDLQIIMNEVIFEQLPDKQKLLVLREALTGVSYDSENDKLVVSQPQKVFRSFVDKYGWDEYEVLLESIETLYQAEKERNKEEGNE